MSTTEKSPQIRENQSAAEAAERGFALIEVMVSILIIAIISLAIVMNLTGALRTAKFTEINHIASSLAISKIEELAAISVQNLDSSFNDEEASVTWPGVDIDFTRTTVVTVNPNDSRTVEVVVSSNSPRIATTVEFTTTFAAWE